MVKSKDLEHQRVRLKGPDLTQYWNALCNIPELAFFIQDTFSVGKINLTQLATLILDISYYK